MTLMAGNSRVLLACISYSLLTPVVVSSETPWHALAILVHFWSSFFKVSLMMLRTSLNSGLSVELGSGTVPSFL